MEGREGRDPGYDDWFDEPEPPTQESGRSSGGAYDGGDDVWVLPGEDARQRGPRREFVIAGRTLSGTQAAIVAASVLAIFFAVLAAAGVFSGTAKPQAGITNPPPPTTTASTTTANTTPAVQPPTTTLKPGDTGAQVKALQRALTALGFSPGKADGDYGPGTENAVKGFQSAHGLTSDGVVGPKTLAAIQQALSG